MKFKKFNSIDNVERTKTTNYYIDCGLTTGEWEVTEKIHGSCLAIFYDGNEIKIAKRSTWLEPNENFNNALNVVNKLKNNIIDLWNDLYTTKKQKYMFLYGEIFGGSYDHPEVEKVKGSIRCQKGVFYSPDNHFYGFDILIDENYLTTYEVDKYFNKHRFFYAKPLFRGTFEECINYPNEFESKIPDWLGLPLISNNICEGVVIRPTTPKFLPSGERVILKNKNDKWKEKESKPKKIKEEINLTDKANILLQEYNSYITENRLRNVLSKIGKISNKDFGKLVGMMAQDVLQDFLKDNEESFNTLEKEEQKIIKKRGSSYCADLIRSHFVNILDDIF